MTPLRLRVSEVDHLNLFWIGQFIEDSEERIFEIFGSRAKGFDKRFRVKNNLVGFLRSLAP